MCVQPAVYSTWWGAGSVEGGTGAGGITGATGLGLVEGPFQLPPPLDPAVLLTEVLEDLLCREQTGTRTKLLKPGQRTHRNVDHRREDAALTVVAFGTHLSYVFPTGCQSKSIPNFPT